MTAALKLIKISHLYVATKITQLVSEKIVSFII